MRDGEPLSLEDNGFVRRILTNLAVMLSLMQILSVAGFAYQQRLTLGQFDHFAAVSYALWLAPAVTLLLLRHSALVVVLFAIPVLMMFGGRGYFVWQQYTLHVNSIGQKGDWASWLNTFTGMAGVFLIGLWLLYRVALFLDSLVAKSTSKRRVG